VPGAKGALLRREGLYSSHIVDGAVPATRVLRLGRRTTRLTWIGGASDVVMDETSGSVRRLERPVARQHRAGLSLPTVPI
jgi:hypothetical protein